ncbi:MAG: hypothetical protein DRP02_02330 [Candidatus Gerdarchaeota archaeon]|nr:MAG: hypothetical protein DRP02_02330 [Candidatus Gerdarchaeota archaeon]
MQTSMEVGKQKQATKYTALDIKKLLRQRYSEPEFAFFTEVGNATGIKQSRYIDAISYSLYPSAGHLIEGYEIKVSRSDFLHEMDNPQKGIESMEFCDRYWVVAPKGVVVKEELPPEWGYIEVSDAGKMIRRKQAHRLSPKTLDKSFIAALLRRATEGTIPKDQVKEMRKEIYEQAEAEMKRRNMAKFGSFEELKQKVEDFESASGVEIARGWKAGKEAGVVVKMILENKIPDYQISNMIENLHSLEKGIRAVQKMQNTLYKSQ